VDPIRGAENQDVERRVLDPGVKMEIVGGKLLGQGKKRFDKVSACRWSKTRHGGEKKA